MTEQELKNFIGQYSQDNFSKINFDWNGKHADELEDPNMDFRMQICEFLAQDFSIASDELIIDLFIELSKSSKETWGVYVKYHLFAQELLERGGSKYLIHYLRGATYSFDTSIASGNLQLSEQLKNELKVGVEEGLRNSKNEQELKLWKFGQRRFGTPL